MTYDREPRRIGYDTTRLGWGLRSFVSKALAFTAAAIVLVCAIAFSIVVFTVVMAVLIVFGAYVWWRTRALRKEMRAASASSAASDAIEGEVITRTVRDIEPHERDRR